MPTQEQWKTNGKAFCWIRTISISNASGATRIRKLSMLVYPRLHTHSPLYTSILVIGEQPSQTRTQKTAVSRGLRGVCRQRRSQPHESGSPRPRTTQHTGTHLTFDSQQPHGARTVQSDICAHVRNSLVSLPTHFSQVREGVATDVCYGATQGIKWLRQQEKAETRQTPETNHV